MNFLLHIPKTGGQTLAHRLSAGFAPERCWLLQRDVADAADLAALAARYDLFEGHPAAAVFDRRPPGLTVLAAVRDPVEHIVSHYRHILREPQLPLHPPAAALPPTAFLERFAHILFNFQARCLVRAWRGTPPEARVRGEDLFLLREMEAAAAQVDRLLPSERIDEFCLLWSLETGRPVHASEQRVNESGADGVDAPALRAWLRARPERYLADLTLWETARRRFTAWREELLATDRATGMPARAHLAWEAPAEAEGGAAIWLTRHWHRPARREDGIVEWWAGPSMFPEFRVRRGGRALLRFEALSMLGVRWNRVRLLRRPGLEELPLRRTPDGVTGVVVYECDVAALGADETLVLYAPEDVTVLPALPVAWERPRRGFATQNWELA